MNKVIEYKKYKIDIIQDIPALDPREEFDGLGTMVCFHKRYQLGDKHNYPIEEAQKIIKSKEYIALPLYLYDHSGLTMNTTGFECQWDSGQVGWIFISRKKVRKEYGWKQISKKRYKQIEEALRSEVKEYDDFLRGEVYGYKVTSPEDEELHSCWGYYGDPEESGVIDDAKSIIDAYIEKEEKENGVQLELSL
jgi:hypothetical protein